MLGKLYNKWRMRSQKGKEQQREYAFLKDIKGVVHVGANRGSERHLYGSFNLDVLWVEADPRLFKQLKKNIKDYHRQKAVNALVSETDGDSATFYVASNNGASSSMLPMQGHSDMFPGVTVSDQIELKTATLKKIMHDNIEDPSRFDALVIDVQGAELQVLKGAFDAIGMFKYLKVEAADFPAYENAAHIDEIVDYCEGCGFRVLDRIEFAHKEGIGSFYDVIFIRADA